MHGGVCFSFFGSCRHFVLFAVVAAAEAEGRAWMCVVSGVRTKAWREYLLILCTGSVCLHVLYGWRVCVSGFLLIWISRPIRKEERKFFRCHRHHNRFHRRRGFALRTRSLAFSLVFLSGATPPQEKENPRVCVCKIAQRHHGAPVRVIEGVGSVVGCSPRRVLSCRLAATLK